VSIHSISRFKQLIFPILVAHDGSKFEYFNATWNFMGGPKELRKKPIKLTPDFLIYGFFILKRKYKISRKKLEKQEMHFRVLESLFEFVDLPKNNKNINTTINFKDVSIPRENLLISNGESLNSSNYFTQNASADLYKFQAGLVFRKNFASEITLNHAFYLGSHRDEFYYHALIWSGAKIQSAYNFLSQNPNGIIIFNSDMQDNVRTFFLHILGIQSKSKQVVTASESNPIFVKLLQHMPLDPIRLFESKDFDSSVEFMRKNVASRSRINKLPKILLLKRASKLILTRKRLVNLCMLEALLTKIFHVDFIDPADLTVKDQSKLFAEADFVISEHGGALANIIFCKNTVKVIELKLELVSDLYERLAKSRAIKYHEILIKEVNGCFELNKNHFFEIYRIIKENY
jgi:hypothetical protein